MDEGVGVRENERMSNIYVYPYEERIEEGERARKIRG